MTDLAPETFVHVQYFSEAFDLERARRYATAELFKYTINYEAQAWEGEVRCAINHHRSSIPFLIYPVAESKTAFLFKDRFLVNKPPHSRQVHRARLLSTSNSYPEMIPGSGRPCHQPITNAEATWTLAFGSVAGCIVQDHTASKVLNAARVWSYKCDAIYLAVLNWGRNE